MEHFRPVHLGYLKHLAVFALVVDAGSFTGAGRRLGIAKSAVSRYVTELEDYLGASLLRRTTRKLFLTEVGERFFAQCEHFMDAALDTLGSIQEETPMRGHLHIGATHAFGLHVVAPALQEFMNQHAELSVRMSLSEHPVDLVSQGIDVTFRIGTPGNAPSYISRRIGSTRYQLWASEDFLKTHGTPTHPKNLESLPGLLSQLQPNPYDWTFVQGGQSISVKANTRFMADSAEVGIHMANGGLGVLGLPDFIGIDRGPSLRPILRDYVVEPPLPIYAVYPQRRFLSQRAAAFVKHVEQRCPAAT